MDNAVKIIYTIRNKHPATYHQSFFQLRITKGYPESFGDSLFNGIFRSKCESYVKNHNWPNNCMSLGWVQVYQSQEAVSPDYLNKRKEANIMKSVLIAEDTLQNIGDGEYGPECTLCQFSGYSELCDLSHTGTCVYHQGLEEMKELQQSGVSIH